MHQMTVFLLDYAQDMHTVANVSTVAAVIAGVLFFGLLITELHSRTHCTAQVLARCIETQDQVHYLNNGRGRSTRSISTVVKLEYDVNGQTYTGFLTPTGNDRIPQEGEDVMILVNPDNPSQMRGEHQKTEWGGMTVVGVFFFLMLALIIYARSQF